MKATLLLRFSLTAAAALVADSAAAQTEAKTWEMSLNGSYSHSWVNGVSSDINQGLTLYSGALSVGYFFTDALELKANVSVLGFDGLIG